MITYVLIIAKIVKYRFNDNILCTSYSPCHEAEIFCLAFASNDQSTIILADELTILKRTRSRLQASGFHSCEGISRDSDVIAFYLLLCLFVIEAFSHTEFTIDSYTYREQTKRKPGSACTFNVAPNYPKNVYRNFFH